MTFRYMGKAALNLFSFCNKVKSTAKAVDYLQKVGVLCRSVNCEKCEKNIDIVKRRPGTNYFYFPCEDCKTVKSVREHAILATELQKDQISLFYGWGGGRTLWDIYWLGPVVRNFFTLDHVNPCLWWKKQDKIFYQLSVLMQLML